MSNIQKNKRYHFIYKTTNILNGKYYIGMHSTSNIKDGYLGSGKRLKYSINKYGKENFICEILEFFDSREKLTKRERELINIKLLKDPDCLNLQEGGISGFDYILNKRKTDIEYDKKWKSLQSLKLIEAHKKGLINYDTFSGKEHSEKTKILMSKKKQGYGLGQTNTQFGTCWITKNNINKKIKKEDIENWITEGWIKGRTQSLKELMNLKQNKLK